ncbi:hypothetical protein [Streptomyces sp. NPDC006645]|uniref:hypothetical protein n=1 Tax=unclassified Streptomyces TaxID=2593676 RepID=UPI0033A56E5C
MAMEQLAGIADRLPLLTQIHPDPRSSTSEDLEDAIRDLTRHFTYLAYIAATRDRLAHRCPGRYTPELREGTAALARAATPAGHALAALGAAVTATGHLHHLAHSPPGPRHAQDLQHTIEVLGAHVTQARTQLFAAARQLRADTDRLLTAQTPPAPTASAAITPTATSSSHRGRSR